VTHEYRDGDPLRHQRYQGPMRTSRAIASESSLSSAMRGYGALSAGFSPTSMTWARTQGAVAVLRKGWGGAVPLVVLSRQTDLDERTAEIGAVAGLRKPLIGEALMGTVQRLVPLPD
jgi:hypothetical protein